MPRGALKMAIFFNFHPPPGPLVKSLFGDSLDSFETVACPQKARQALETFFGARGQRYLTSTGIDYRLIQLRFRQLLQTTA